MALLPQKTRPVSSQFTRVRIGPNRVPADRSLPAMCAPYPADKSTNASNKNVLAVDCSLVATYAPIAAPTQLTGIAAAAIVQWNITSQEAANGPDVIPGDLLTFLSQDNIPGTTRDALTNAGLYPLTVYVTGTGPYNIVMLLYNGSGATASTPAGYIPNLLWERFNNLTTDPNPVP